MRQAIGSTWILQLVILFMLIFVGFLALSINYTKAFKIKNEMLSIIEKYEGVMSGENKSVSLINNYLRYYHYQAKGNCPTDTYGAVSLDDASLVRASSGVKYYYCVKKINTSDSSFRNRARYEIDTFFQFNLPIIGNLFTFHVSGSTIDINFPKDDVPVILN